MPKPITPLVGCDVAVISPAREILLVRRTDNGFWVMPGGCQDMNETPEECAVREFREETGFEVKLSRLLGVFSSKRYEYVHYPWKENVFTHLLFSGRIAGGEARLSDETNEIGRFGQDALPPLSDGHDIRIRFAFQAFDRADIPPYYE